MTRSRHEALRSAVPRLEAQPPTTCEGSATPLARLRDKKVIVASVAAGPYTNFGNRLIEQSTLRLLGLPTDTPRFSAFERITEELLEFINCHDVLLVTGCTTLQDEPGQQRCFDETFERVRIPKACFGASFYCEPEDRPSLRIARLYDRPIGARDPWTAEYLARHGVRCLLVGCPTLLDAPQASRWREDDGGTVLISSTPPLEPSRIEHLHGRLQRLLAHESGSPGEELLDATVFEGISRVVTGRLHAALPAIARGIPVEFYGPPYWHPAFRSFYWGRVRYSLLEHLGIPFDGGEPPGYPAARIEEMRANLRSWVREALA